VTPNRYNADVFGVCNDTHTFADCLKRQGLGDCVKGGIDWHSVRARADQMASLDTASRIISNWCSHKRLFSQLAESSNAPFAMVLEDDAVLNLATFKTEVESFLLAYAAAEWDVVVVDPLNVQFDIVHKFRSTGARCDAFKVGSHRGRAIWQVPLATRPALRCMVQQCNFCGNQALLVRKSALKRIVASMESMRVLPGLASALLEPLLGMEAAAGNEPLWIGSRHPSVLQQGGYCVDDRRKSNTDGYCSQPWEPAPPFLSERHNV